MIIGFICGLGKNVSQLKYAPVGHGVRKLRTLSPLLTDQESARDGLKLSPNSKGMMHIFNADMPRRVEPFVRQRLIGKHCRTYYYEYRNGTRLISPAIQEEVRSLFREAGWKEEVNFDGYVEDYEW